MFWRDPLRILGVAIIVTIFVKIVSQPYFPAVSGFLTVASVCLVVAAMILALMRKNGRF